MVDYRYVSTRTIPCSTETIREAYWYTLSDKVYGYPSSVLDQKATLRDGVDAWDLPVWYCDLYVVNPVYKSLQAYVPSHLLHQHLQFRETSTWDADKSVHKWHCYGKNHVEINQTIEFIPTGPEECKAHIECTVKGITFGTPMLLRLPPVSKMITKAIDDAMCVDNLLASVREMQNE